MSEPCGSYHKGGGKAQEALSRYLGNRRSMSPWPNEVVPTAADWAHRGLGGSAYCHSLEVFRGTALQPPIL